MPKKPQIFVLLAEGIVGISAVVILILALIVLLAFLGVFQSPVQLSANANATCGGSLSYSVQLTGSDGRGVSGPTSTYVDGVLLEKLNTDQNGRFSSTQEVKPDWCGKMIDLSIVYSGDIFHKNDSGSASVPVYIPTSIRLSVPAQAQDATGVLINATLADSRGVPLSNETVLIGSYGARTDASGIAQTSVSFNETGMQSIPARFEGDGFYLPSDAAAPISVVPRSCSDGTVVGHCSQVSYLCDEQEKLVFDCADCGCGQGLICSNDSCITQEQQTEQIISAAQKSVVYVEVPGVDSGSGVILSQGNGQTVILTNDHVVNESSGIANVLIETEDQKTATASDIRVAPYGIDLAVIYVHGTYGEPAMIRNENESQGATVVAIGSPLGLQNTVTNGIISNFVQNSGTKYIQTDAAINHGNSGGGLFLTSDGSLIGINTLGYTGSAPGIGFAIDINELQSLPAYSNWSEFVPLLACQDGTPYGSCSSSLAGGYCSSGELVPKCSYCGCTSAYPFCNSDSGACFSCSSGGTGHVDGNGDSYCCDSGYGNYVDNNGKGFCCAPGDGAWADSNGNGFCCPPGETGTNSGACQ